VPWDRLDPGKAVLSAEGDQLAPGQLLQAGRIQDTGNGGVAIREGAGRSWPSRRRPGAPGSAGSG
jgi:hypothetical protein